MKTIINRGLTIAALFAATAAGATPTYFTDRAAFEAAVHSNLFQGFEDPAITAPGTAFYLGYTITAPALSVGQGPDFDSVYPSEGVKDFSAYSQVDFAFESKVYAFGIDVIGFGTVDTATLAINTDGIEHDLLSNYRAPANGLANFFGVLDPVGFSQVRLTDDDLLDYVEFDALAVRTTPLTAPAGAVPEPSDWALLLAGFGLTGIMARRRTTFLAA